MTKSQRDRQIELLEARIDRLTLLLEGEKPSSKKRKATTKDEVKVLSGWTLKEFQQETNLDLTGWTALDVALSISEGHIELPANWTIGPKTASAVAEGRFEYNEDGNAVFPKKKA